MIELIVIEGFSKEEAQGIREANKYADKALESCFEVLYDESVAETVKVHAEIQDLLCNMEGRTLEYYNEVYIAVLNGLLNASVGGYNGLESESRNNTSGGNNDGKSV